MTLQEFVALWMLCLIIGPVVTFLAWSPFIIVGEFIQYVEEKCK